ncbi:alpha/beta fold hydrolase [Cytobacillus purgationiresistens]|uniref:Pimeloyl-ACP methyl ester carboxylesterase n=1 Tax=Cytobacillus purgationiresistens TaxID=863449 RepID=A0ABU0AHA4_9BACI|nr:alpha/beta hydrolase [Cytobacillus purgationiresistens]MDQ0270643.1 pimeloyl-ACP methyl ester carboxylesterase [Cytobacillus purgationiresistens]
MNQSTLKIISNGGHELNREQPEDFAEAINDFLNDIILNFSLHNPN